MTYGGSFNYGTPGPAYDNTADEEQDAESQREPPKKDPLPEIAKNQELMRVWLAHNLQTNPSKLTPLSINPSEGELKYDHPLHKEVTLDRHCIRFSYSPFYGTLYLGLESKEFLAFSSGYLGTRKRPGFFHFVKRDYYDAGVEARTRTEWPERETPEEDERGDDGRTPPSYYQIRKGF